jgi:hypothetical protein
VCDLTSKVANLPWSEASSEEALSNAWDLICKCGANAAVVGAFSKSGFSSRMKIIAMRLPKDTAAKAGTPIATTLKILACQDQGGTAGSDGVCKPSDAPAGPIRRRR